MWLLLALLNLAPADARPAVAGADLSAAFADVVAAVGATTVHIEVEKARPWSKGLTQLFVERGLPLPPSKGETSRSSGSGVLVREDGLLLTNHHVVGGAVRIAVTLRDGRRYAGELLGSDPRTDVAVVRIGGGQGGFPAARLGPPEGPRVGSWVLTIGHPYEFNFTVSAGIVSAVGRRNLVADEITDYIQTDVVAHPGSSGGPLFDLNGRLVGLTTAIYAPKGGAPPPGISFAIPAALAARVADQLLQQGRVERATIGLFVEDAPPGAEGAVGGARVRQVSLGGPAATAGLLPGDVLREAGGQPVAGARDLRALVLTAAPGAPLALSYDRAGERKTVELRLGAASAPPAGLSPRPAGALVLGGMVVTAQAPDLAASHGIEAAPGALLVTEVSAGSPAAQAGILPGDVLVKAAERPLPDLAALMAIAEERRVLPLRISRGGGELLAVMVR
jgi:S1-C subfamily serine protease